MSVQGSRHVCFEQEHDLAGAHAKDVSYQHIGLEIPGGTGEYSTGKRGSSIEAIANSVRAIDGKRDYGKGSWKVRVLVRTVPFKKLFSFLEGSSENRGKKNRC